jgi:PBSX family phage terminase large subunit
MKKIHSSHSFINKWVMPNSKTLEYLYGDNTFNITEGPIRSGKSSDNIFVFCKEIEKSRDMLHLAVGVTSSSAKAILFDGEGLGIQHWPDWQERVQVIEGKTYKFKQRIFQSKYKGNDCLVLLPKEKSKMPIKYIVAFGGSTISSHEPYKGYSIGMFIATQWELLHKNTRNELLKRTALSSHRKHFIDLNPTDPNHDIYKQMKIWEKSRVVNYIHKTMLDNPVMTKERMAEIMAEYDPNSIDYQRDILGKRVVAEGLIYTVDDKKNIIDKFDPDDYHSYVIVADSGESMSATAFIMLGVTKGFRNVDVLKEYRHRNDDNKGLGVKMPYDYAIDYLTFIKECRDIMGKRARDVYSDHDLTFMREYERNQYEHSVGDTLIKAIKEEIATRIKTGINLLWLGRLRFYKECEWSIKSFRTAVYNPKESVKGIYVRLDDPMNGTLIDNIDAIEYGISSFKYELGLYRER